MDIYFDILKYLAQNDNGEFVEITSLHPDFKVLCNKTEELKKKGYLDIKSTGVYVLGGLDGNIKTYGDETNLKKIFAKILFSGHEYLKQNESKENIKSGIIGNTFINSTISDIQLNSNINQSRSEKDPANPITQTINKTNASRLEKKSWLEIASWIFGIMVALIALYEFGLKHFLKNN